VLNENFWGLNLYPHQSIKDRKLILILKDWKQLQYWIIACRNNCPIWFNKTGHYSLILSLRIADLFQSVIIYYSQQIENHFLILFIQIYLWTIWFPSRNIVTNFFGSDSAFCIYETNESFLIFLDFASLWPGRFNYSSLWHNLKLILSETSWKNFRDIIMERNACCPQN
jgi:hypothetical protein